MNIFVLFLSQGSCYDPCAAFFRHGVSPGGKKWGEVIGVSPPLSFSIQILRDCVRILPILRSSFSYPYHFLWYRSPAYPFTSQPGHSFQHYKMSFSKSEPSLMTRILLGGTFLARILHDSSAAIADPLLRQACGQQARPSDPRRTARVRFWSSGRRAPVLRLCSRR